MTTSKHNVLLFLCIVFLLALALRSSIKQYIPYANVEGYQERSYTLEMGTIVDQVETDYQKQMIDRKTVYNNKNLQGQRTANGSKLTGDNQFEACQGLFACASTTDNAAMSFLTNGTAGTNGTTGTLKSSSTVPSPSTNVLPSNQEITYVYPPKLSMDDVLSLDLWDAEEKSGERALADGNNMREVAISTVRDYQDTLRDSMMDGMVKTNAMTNASNMLEASIQQQAISGNMPNAMMDGITAATQPITDKVNDLSNTIQQMKAVVDRTRARCNSVRFAFGKGCKI
jgi:hypothetical protein